MAYTTTNLTTLAHLQALAQRSKNAEDALSTRIGALEDANGETNVIETVKVNGTALAVTDKAVDVTVPTAVSELTNDSGFQTSTEVATAIETAIAETGHASFEVAASVPDASAAEENVLYLVMNDDTGHYDIYALVSGSVVLIDDTTVDLTDYVTNTALNTTLADYAKTADIVEYTHPTYTEYVSGFYKITVDSTGHVSAAVAVTADDIEALGVAITDTTYDEATTTEAGLLSAEDKTKLDSIEIATDAEVTEMLTEIYGE